MKTKNFLALLPLLLVQIFILSCSSETSGRVTLAISPSASRNADSGYDLLVRVYDAENVVPILTENMKIGGTNSTVTLENIPSNKKIFVYTSASYTDANNGVHAWSGKSSILTLAPGEETPVEINLLPCTMVTFCGGDITSVSENNYNETYTATKPDDGAKLSCWYITVQLKYDDGRTISSTAANCNSILATPNTILPWATYVDKNISGNITLNCYPLTTDQFNVLCQTTSGQDHDDAVKSVLSNPPLYTGSSNFDTHSNDANPVVRIPLTKRGS